MLTKGKGLKKIGLRGHKMPHIKRKPSKGIKRRVRSKRRKKGELTKLKEKLWMLCRQLTKKKYGNSCYTCGRLVPNGKGIHTAHYITSSLCSTALRFDLRNLRPGCYHCNINLSGNWPAYQKAIEKEIPGITGILLAENEATKGITYPLSWFQAKILEYEAKLI